MQNLRLWDIIDILIVAYVIYRIILLIKGTRAVQMLIGLVVVIGLYGISYRMGLFTLHWILNNFLASIILVCLSGILEKTTFFKKGEYNAQADHP